MVRWLPYLLILLGTVTGLKVMTFNIWLSGAEVHDGMGKIADQIRQVNPDVVALQEVETTDVVANLTAMLGDEWTGVHHCNSTYPDTGILTRHTVIDGTYMHVDTGMHVKIQIKNSKRQISFWSMHLDWRSYGPYACYNKLVSSAVQIMAGEMPTTKIGRVQNIKQLVTLPAFITQMAKSKIVPVIVAGDFNAPSDQDWTEENRDDHGGWIFPWPATKILRDTTGMVDSFRELHPDPIADPGFTWSTVNKFNSDWDYTIPEPEDRIDFIFYTGPIKPVTSERYAGKGKLTPIPNQWDNEWPSDHYAVVTDFEDQAMVDGIAPEVLPVDPIYETENGREIRCPLCDPLIYRGGEVISGVGDGKDTQMRGNSLRRKRIIVRNRQ